MLTSLYTIAARGRVCGHLGNATQICTGVSALHLAPHMAHDSWGMRLQMSGAACWSAQSYSCGRARESQKYDWRRSWQPDSYGTGGVTGDDYRTIQWFKVDALTGGTGYLWQGESIDPQYSTIQDLHLFA